jgi:hypothetical protein
MEKVERSLIEPVGEVNFHSSRWNWDSRGLGFWSWFHLMQRFVNDKSVLHKEMALESCSLTGFVPGQTQTVSM